MGYVDDQNGKRRSRTIRYSGGRYSGRWGDSQESFVLGVNDPNSPTRLSPVLSTDSALRGPMGLGASTERNSESRGKEAEKA